MVGCQVLGGHASMHPPAPAHITLPCSPQRPLTIGHLAMVHSTLLGKRTLTAQLCFIMGFAVISKIPMHVHAPSMVPCSFPASLWGEPKN